MTVDAAGEEMMGWMRDLFPINRSLTGNGVRQTLAYLSRLLPGLEIVETPSGARAFGWTVPDEWNARAAYIENEAGERVVNCAVNNLHLVGYSEPIDVWLDRESLEGHLHSLPDKPDSIPYVTSYYARRWGFCLSDRQRKSLPSGRYHVVIDADLAPGSLTYGTLVLPGSSGREALFSTYICHPSMANNELSESVVATALARALASIPDRRLTYRFVFVPETIGAWVYLSLHLDHLKRCLDAGFVMTGVGDERQYCAPGVDLPVASIARSKYATYPEYHTSGDDLELVTPAGLAGSLSVYRQCARILENNLRYRMTVLGEPQLGRRGLYPNLSTPDSAKIGRDLLNVIAYCDGRRDLIEIADRVGLSANRVLEMIEPLRAHGLIEPMSEEASPSLCARRTQSGS